MPLILIAMTSQMNINYSGGHIMTPNKGEFNVIFYVVIKIASLLLTLIGVIPFTTLLLKLPSQEAPVIIPPLHLLHHPHLQKYQQRERKAFSIHHHHHHHNK